MEKEKERKKKKEKFEINRGLKFEFINLFTQKGKPIRFSDGIKILWNPVLTVLDSI